MIESLLKRAFLAGVGQMAFDDFAKDGDALPWDAALPELYNTLSDQQRKDLDEKFAKWFDADTRYCERTAGSGERVSSTTQTGEVDCGYIPADPLNSGRWGSGEAEGGS